jgi:hypothetical protein
VDHIVAGFEIELIRRKLAEVRDAGFGDGFGRFEKIFRAEDGQPGFLKHCAARHLAANQGHRAAARLRTLPQIFRRAVAGQFHLVGHRIFAEDVGQALDFAGGRGEERQLAARLNQGLSFSYRHLQIAMERHGGARRNVEALGIREPDIQLPGLEHAVLQGQFAEFVPFDGARFRFHVRGARRIPQPAPEAHCGGRGHLRLIDYDERFFKKIEDGSLGRFHRGDEQLPARERLAIDRKLARPHARFAQILRQPREQLTRLTELREGRENALAQLVDGTLRFGVEAAYGFDLIAKELDADGLLLVRWKDVENAATNGVFAHHFDGIAALIADAFEVRGEIVERDFFMNTQRQGELPVVVRRRDAGERGGHGQHHYAGFAVRQTVERSRARGENLGMGRHALPRQNVESGQKQWSSAGVQKIAESSEQGVKRFGLFIAVGDQDQRALGFAI